jgi:hypothetical protein
VNLALCLIELGRGQEARSHLHAVLEPDVPDAGPVLRASCHLALCAVRDPEDDWSHHWREANVLFEQGTFVARDIATLAEAVAEAAESKSRSGEAAQAWMLAASQWRALRREQRAVRAERSAEQA